MGWKDGTNGLRSRGCRAREGPGPWGQLLRWRSRRRCNSAHEGRSPNHIGSRSARRRPPESSRRADTPRRRRPKRGRLPSRQPSTRARDSKGRCPQRRAYPFRRSPAGSKATPGTAGIAWCTPQRGPAVHPGQPLPLLRVPSEISSVSGTSSRHAVPSPAALRTAASGPLGLGRPRLRQVV